MLNTRIVITALISLLCCLPVLAEVDSDEAFPERFRLTVQVEEVSTRLSKTVVFRLNVLEKIDVDSWALYIFDHRPHFESLQQFPRSAIRTLKGMGRVPRLASWDCKTTKGILVPEGKYYLMLWIKDQAGKRWLSYWQSFKVK